MAVERLLVVCQTGFWEAFTDTASSNIRSGAYKRVSGSGGWRGLLVAKGSQLIKNTERHLAPTKQPHKSQTA